MMAGAALHQGEALVWNLNFSGLLDELDPFLARGFSLATEMPLQGMGSGWFATLTAPPDVDDARDLTQLVAPASGA